MLIAQLSWAYGAVYAELVVYIQCRHTEIKTEMAISQIAPVFWCAEVVLNTYMKIGGVQSQV